MLSTAVVFLMLHKPVCNKERDGWMWPEAANHNSAILLMAVRAGTLEMCVANEWGYKWEHPTVNIHQR